LVTAQNLYSTAEEFVKNALFPNVNRFFTDPSSPQAQQAQQAATQKPDPALELAKAQVQNEAQGNQIEAQKVASEHELKSRELDLRAEDVMTRLEKAANDFTAKLTEIEAKFNVNVPGSRI
jgi:hypothetical protein